MSNPGHESPDNEALRGVRDTLKKLKTSTNVNSFIMIALTIVLIVLTFKLISSFSNHIKEEVFDECFDYYASVSKETGVNDSLIQICKDRAENLFKSNPN